MNQLDIFLGGAVLLFTLAGLFGGAVKRVVQVAAVVIAFRESWRLTPWVQSALEGLLGHPVGAWGFIIPLLGFLIVYLGIRMLGGWFSSLTKGTLLGILDRILGRALGLLVGVYLMGYACLLFEGIFPTPPLKPSSGEPLTTRQTSILYPSLIRAVSDIRQAKTIIFPEEPEQPEEAPTPPPSQKRRR